MMSRKLVLPVFCVLFSGCVYLGRDFATGPIPSIKTNTTTQKEIFGYFGEPFRRGLENGYETWTYSYQHYELGQLRDFKDLYVVFNKDNTVRTYSYSGRDRPNALEEDTPLGARID